MLKRARLKAKVKVEAVTKETGVAVPTVYRHEGGITAVKESLVHDYAKLYGVTDPDEVLKWVKWARKAKQKGPWATSGTILGPTYEDYADAESLCVEMRVYELGVIHGLLQTKAYSQAVIDTDATVHPADSARQADLLKLREMRKEILYRDHPLPPRIWAVLGEAAIQTPPDPTDSKTHREQIEHLLKMGETQQATIQILPMDTGLHTGLSGSFSILTFDVNVDMVFREGYGDGSFLDDEERVRSYRVRYEALQGQALSPADSRRYLHKVHKQLAD
jgi:AcrR family transcriptional regulator